MTSRATIILNVTLTVGCLSVLHATGAEPTENLSPFRQSNLVAWCIVPFDANSRGPAERAKMVKELGLTKVAYDWRAEHVASFEEEIEQYKKHGLDFFAFWNWHDDLEPLLKKHGIHPQIWITLPSPQQDASKPVSQEAKVAAAIEQLMPIVDKTRRLGLKLGLYNHGGWGGQPKNMVAVCDQLREKHDGDHVGIVYNFHHGHEHIDEFPESLASMLPYLLCLNLNGMADPSTVHGNTNKILPIGEGVHERSMIGEIIRQGYDGPIGILDHRNEMDSREALTLNLEGLSDLVENLE